MEGRSLDARVHGRVATRGRGRAPRLGGGPGPGGWTSAASGPVAAGRADRTAPGAKATQGKRPRARRPAHAPAPPSRPTGRGSAQYTRAPPLRGAPHPPAPAIAEKSGRAPFRRARWLSAAPVPEEGREAERSTGAGSAPGPARDGAEEGRRKTARSEDVSGRSGGCVPASSRPRSRGGRPVWAGARSRLDPCGHG